MCIAVNTRRFRLREATKADLDAIVHLHIIGFVEEPMDHYCYPYRWDHPNDHKKWMRMEYEFYLAHPEKYLVQVAEVPRHLQSGDDHTIGSFSVWNLHVWATATGLGKSEANRSIVISMPNAS